VLIICDQNCYSANRQKSGENNIPLKVAEVMSPTLMMMMMMMMMMPYSPVTSSHLLQCEV